MVTCMQVLKKRMGFVRVAMRSGASLVPVIAFGETNTYATNNPDPSKPPTDFTGRFQRCVALALLSTMGIPVGKLIRTLAEARHAHLLPLHAPLTNGKTVAP